MQACPFVPEDLKRALANARKMHSSQCSSLKFGSQRKYFNFLFNRLDRARKQTDEEDDDADDDADGAATGRDEPSDNFLYEHGFLLFPAREDKSNACLCYCRNCAMVPIQFRARGSVFFQKPSLEMVERHRLQCRKSFLDLEILVDAMDDIVANHFHDDLSRIDGEAFRALILAAVGGNEKLTQIFADEVREQLLRKREDGTASEEPAVSSIDCQKGDFIFPPIAVDYASVDSAFRSFAEKVGDTSGSLHNYPSLLQYLLLISPSLVIPEEVDQRKNDKEDTSNNGNDAIQQQNESTSIGEVQSDEKNDDEKDTADSDGYPSAAERSDQ